MRRPFLVALVLGLGLLASACGIPLSKGPTRIAVGLPQAVVNPAQQAADCHADSVHLVKIYIYLVQAIPGTLVPASRCVARPVTPQEVLKALEVGPYETEEREGIETALNASSNLMVQGGYARCAPPRQHAAGCHLVRVRLDRYFFEGEGEAPIEEIGQIVYSLTQSGLGVDEVRFLGATGSPVYVETATGAFVNRPVSVADYNELAG